MKFKVSRILWRGFCGGLFLWLTVVLLLCILKTQNNLFVYRMVLLPMVWAAGAMVIWFALRKAEPFLEKYGKFLMAGFLIVYGTVLLAVCLNFKAVPDNDHLQVQLGAYYMAGLSEEINWEYFAWAKNNVFPVLWLSVIFRLGNVFGKEPDSFAIFCNVIQVLCAIYCVYKIALGESRKQAAAWMAALLLACCLPIIGHTQSLYTDALSFSWGIGAFYLWLLADKGEHGKAKYWILNILSGVVFGIGIMLKATVAISLIALCLYLLLFRTKKDAIRMLVPLICSFAVIAGASAYIATLPCESMRDSNGTPTILYWVDVGLKGNGGYVDNLEYCTQLRSIYGMENKEAFSKQYLKDNLYEFVDIGHIVAKIRYNFANGGLGASDFMRRTENPNFLYECISTEGKYFWYYCMLNTSYFYFLFAMILPTCASGGAHVSLEKKFSAEECVPLLTVFGIMLYVMLFEANNRQLYNQLPWIILGALKGIELIDR